MKKIISFVIVTSVTLFMVGCASMPKEEDLQQLSRAQLAELLPGKTLTRKTDYGRWATYLKDSSSGNSRAWGSWGKEEASSTYTISQEGEVCSTFTGDYDWTKPGNKFCSHWYTDQSGMYYTKTTQDTWKPNRIGKLRKLEIIEGDKYELAKN